MTTCKVFVDGDAVGEMSVSENGATHPDPNLCGFLRNWLFQFRAG